MMGTAERRTTTTLIKEEKSSINQQTVRVHVGARLCILCVHVEAAGSCLFLISKMLHIKRRVCTHTHTHIHAHACSSWLLITLCYSQHKVSLRSQLSGHTHVHIHNMQQLHNAPELMSWGWVGWGASSAAADPFRWLYEELHGSHRLLQNIWMKLQSDSSSQDTSWRFRWDVSTSCTHSLLLDLPRIVFVFLSTSTLSPPLICFLSFGSCVQIWCWAERRRLSGTAVEESHKKRQLITLSLLKVKEMYANVTVYTKKCCIWFTNRNCTSSTSKIVCAIYLTPVSLMNMQQWRRIKCEAGWKQLFSNYILLV